MRAHLIRSGGRSGHRPAGQAEAVDLPPGVLVQLDGVTVRFADRTLFSGVSLDVFAGESVALVGPSGSGKTTLLALIGGLAAPSSGFVRSVLHMPPRPHEVGWVLQTNTVLSQRRVIDNCMLAALGCGASRAVAERDACEALDAVGLGDRLYARAHMLSGGELQRLTIARALAARPQLMVADEPTANLDRTTASVVADILIAARPPGTAVVLATHDPEVAARCARQVTVSRDGLLSTGLVDVSAAGADRPGSSSPVSPR